MGLHLASPGRCQGAVDHPLAGAREKYSHPLCCGLQQVTIRQIPASLASCARDGSQVQCPGMESAWLVGRLVDYRLEKGLQRCHWTISAFLSAIPFLSFRRYIHCRCSECGICIIWLYLRHTDHKNTETPRVDPSGNQVFLGLPR
jgi:hypothetical protein